MITLCIVLGCAALGLGIEMVAAHIRADGLARRLHRVEVERDQARAAVRRQTARVIDLQRTGTRGGWS